MRLKNPQNENGSVLVYILLAVALFAALGVTVSSMMRAPSGGSISKEKQGIFASEILSYAQNVKDVVKDLQISNDCDATEISFENAFITGYEHSPVAADECKVFSSGGTAYIRPNVEWLEQSHSAAATYGEYVFTAATPIDGIGQDSGSGEGNDIAIVLNYLRDEICEEINTKAGITNTGNAPPLDLAAMDTATKFTGSFASADPIDANETLGKFYGCVQNSAGTLNAFYYVLVAR